MTEHAEALRVAWCSEMKLPAQDDHHFCFKSGDFPPCRDDFEVIVIDLPTIECPDDFKTRYTKLGLPALIIVDTLQEETHVLTWLQNGDEVCRREAMAEQLLLRLERAVRHGKSTPQMNLDSLTGLPNRRGLEEYATAQFAISGPEESWCLILLDLDYFKLINDQLGSSAGDCLLRNVGDLLTHSLSGTGIVARVGGDEFAILVRGSPEQGGALAEFLRGQILSHEFNFGTIPVHVSASFGLVSHIGADSIQSAEEKASACLLGAKRRERNRVVCVEQVDANADAAGRDSLVGDFENRLRVTTARMTGALVMKARRFSNQPRQETDHDELTKIFNRSYLDRLLERQLEKSRKQGRYLTIALLDLDQFGGINRTYGFPTGDRVLRAAAITLQRSARAGDWLARSAGGEFCIVLPDTGLDAGRQIAERIRVAMGNEIIPACDGRQVRITVSVGVVELLPEDADATALFQRASNTVQEAKLGGRNRIQS